MKWRSSLNIRYEDLTRTQCRLFTAEHKQKILIFGFAQTNKETRNSFLVFTPLVLGLIPKTRTSLFELERFKYVVLEFHGYEINVFHGLALRKRSVWEI